MPPHIFGELLHRVVTTVGLFAQRHEHDVVQIPSEFALQSRGFLRTHFRDRVRRDNPPGGFLRQANLFSGRSGR